MPDVLQGLASFPGVDQVASWSASLAHGISPSVLTIDTAPQCDFVGAGGDFTVEFGNTSFTFSDCRVWQAHYRATAAGRVWTLVILDRRWKWQGLGLVSGAYNLRNDDNSLRDDTEQMTPQDLMSACLDALGEEEYDVSDAPTGVYPTIEWDSVRPSDALADLCDQYGCRVALQTDDTVKICVVGQGAALPIDDGVMENSLAIDPPERPDQTAIVCARNRYQVDLPLEPVGAESDRTVTAIDELSYAPGDGWESVDLVDFRAVDAEHRALAQEWIYRAYRIATPFNVPEFGQATDLDQILPIEHEQVETTTDDEGLTTSAPAIVWGQFFAGGETLANNLTSLPADFGDVPVEAVYQRPFTIDRQRGLVWFDEQVYANGAAATPLAPTPATIYLRTAIGVRDPDTGAWQRYTRTRNGGGQFDTQTLCEKHDEIIYAVTPVYNGQTLVDSDNNAATVNPLCDALLDAIDAELDQGGAQTIKYAGIRQIEIDGAIQEVVWRGGLAGATTVASHNQESGGFGPGYHDRRACEKQRELDDLRRLDQDVVLQRRIQALSLG